MKDSETGSLRIVVDGGMAKYRVRWEGREFEVPDLSKHSMLIFSNPLVLINVDKHTAIIELGKDFTIEAIPITIKQKPLNVPVLNRGIIWTDATTGNIYIAGGHFFKQAYWDASEFYVPDDQIPDFSIWKYDLKADSWEEITPIGEDMTRLISSAYTSIPTMDRSFAFGYGSPLRPLFFHTLMWTVGITRRVVIPIMHRRTPVWLPTEWLYLTTKQGKSSM